MFDRNWRQFVAIGFIVTLGACSVPFPWPTHQPFEQQANDQRYSERCGETQQQEDNDLCQQWRMAVAAEHVRDIAIAQTGILIAALAFSIWAAVASSRQARAAEEQLASMERAHLLVHFEDIGFQSDPVGNMPARVSGPTKWKLHNYSDTVAFIRWRHVCHSFLPEPKLPPPLNWEAIIGSGVPHGVIAPPKDDSMVFSELATDSVSNAQIEAHQTNGRWFFQGFVAFQDNTPGVHVLVFTYMLEEGEWRILTTGSFEEDAKYNDSRHRYRPNRWRWMRSRIARRMRKCAEMIEPKQKT